MTESLHSRTISLKSQISQKRTATWPASSATKFSIGQSNLALTRHVEGLHPLYHKRRHQHLDLLLGVLGLFHYLSHGKVIPLLYQLDLVLEEEPGPKVDPSPYYHS